MQNYVFIYYTNMAMTGAPDPAVTAAWQKWFGELGDKLVDAGNPFAPNGKAVEKSGVTTIENYPATGYTIVKATSLDEAVEMAKGCPVVENGAVRVYQTMPM